MKDDNTVALTPKCTIIYPSLFEPESYGNSEPVYKAGFLIGQDEDINVLRNAVRAAAVKKWPNKPSDFFTSLTLPLRNGNSKAVDENGNPDKSNFYYNKIHFNAKSKWQPQIVNIYNDPINDPEEIYGGCIVQAYISFYGYDYMGKMGVGAGIRAVCKIDDGDPLGGGRIDTANVFNSVIKERETFQNTMPDDDSMAMRNDEWGDNDYRNKVIVDVDPNILPSANPKGQPDNELPQEPPGGLYPDDPDSVPF